MSELDGLSTFIENPVDTFVKDVADARRVEMAANMAKGDHPYTQGEIFQAIKDAEDEIIDGLEDEELSLGGPMMRLIAQAQLANTLRGHEEDE